MFLNAKDFTYDLPDNRIANEPVANRHDSKLLVYEAGSVKHSTFSQLPDLLPANSTLVVNETKVLHARMYMQKPTGGKVEVMCLEPLLPSQDPVIGLSSTGETVWRCMLGGKRLRVGQELTFTNDDDSINLKATLLGQDTNKFDVRFNWNGESTFADILERHGNIPIPPYMRREAKAMDKDRYQTVYAQALGSVAAPTAGLHFTDQVFNNLEKRGIHTVPVALHVGAGTFVPISAENVGEHTMHSEHIVVARETVDELITKLKLEVPITAVGTTSVRTLETLYWLGVKHIVGASISKLHQWEPYEQLHASSASITAQSALTALASLEKDIVAETQLMIVPGYSFKIVDNIVTNFHQPGSTLLCLVAAFVGEKWRDIYEEALAKDYRFLSYGDSSLLIGSR